MFEVNRTYDRETIQNLIDEALLEEEFYNRKFEKSDALADLESKAYWRQISAWLKSHLKE